MGHGEITETLARELEAAIAKQRGEQAEQAAQTPVDDQSDMPTPSAPDWPPRWPSVRRPR